MRSRISIMKSQRFAPRPFVSVLAVAMPALIAQLHSAPGNPDADFPKSPEVHADGRVTFRVIAPGAEKVLLKGAVAAGENALAPAADGKGLWEITVGPVEPGLHDYWFDIDGVYTLDPHNRAFKAWRRSANLVEVPADPPAAWQLTAVPHGTLHRHAYHSVPLQTERECFVYTPPGYEDDPARRYPVLFLLHGSGDDASGWTAVGRAHCIADNLIAAGVAEPLVIVMPHGHAHRPGVDPDAIEDRAEWYRENDAAMADDFFRSVVPLVEKTYRLQDGPDRAAIAGLSMGGGQSLRIGLNHPEKFAWVAGFSSAVPADEKAAAEQYAAFDPRAARRRIWIGCGRSDFLLDRNDFFHGWLDAKSVPHEYVLTEGGHAWPVWRGYLEIWLRGLFR